MGNPRLSCSAIQEKIDKAYEEHIQQIAGDLFKEFEDWLEEPTEWKDGKCVCKITDIEMVQYRPAIISKLKKFFEPDVEIESGMAPHEIIIKL